ncbi:MULTISPECIES: hypothetical protein [Comamonas]|uniref:Uncharacterized protein n=1 Tax=Comamonas terrigena TaxID=32013 RepID=A0A2A7URA0_COMTR|nr:MULTISPECIES: hypothetical protein [Comamonas]MBD9532868.1 hypothetical protein [Comamonas sp. CMM01]PEH87691.1 hypothetical protein CRM82_02905 [Comamonas terrigena]
MVTPIRLKNAFQTQAVHAAKYAAFQRTAVFRSSKTGAFRAVMPFVEPRSGSSLYDFFFISMK